MQLLCNWSICCIINQSIMLPIHVLCYQSIYYVTNTSITLPIFYATNQSITLPINQLHCQSINCITNQSITLPSNVMLPVGWLCNHQRVRQLLFVSIFGDINRLARILGGLPCRSYLKPVDYIVFNLYAFLSFCFIM